MSWRLTSIDLHFAANFGDGPNLNAHQIIGFRRKRQFVAGSPLLLREWALLRPLRPFRLYFGHCSLGAFETHFSRGERDE
jgi:hypothetical protein